MYECFHCGSRGVIWDNDFSFEDFGYEGEGIVHVCTAVTVVRILNIIYH